MLLFNTKSSHQRDTHHYIPHLPSSILRNGLSLILILDAPAALTVPEAAPAARTPLAPKVGGLLVAAVTLVALPADTEEDGGDQPARESGPGESVGVFA